MLSISSAGHDFGWTLPRGEGFTLYQSTSLNNTTCCPGATTS